MTPVSYTHLDVYKRQVWNIANATQAIRELSREHLSNHGFGLVEVLRRRDHLGNQFAVLGLAGHETGREDRAIQRRKRVGVLANELLADAECATRVPIPDFLGQDVDEADLVVDRPLVEGVWPQKAIDVAGTQVGCLLYTSRCV